YIYLILLCFGIPTYHPPPPSPTRRSSDLAARPTTTWTCAACCTAQATGSAPSVRPPTASISPTPIPSSSSRSSKRCPISGAASRSEEHTTELQSRFDLVCRPLLEKTRNRA